MKKLDCREIPPSRILVVDNETAFLTALTDVLTDLGYPVAATPEPLDALERVSRDKFDIVFLDQYLGPVRGTELMQKMAARDEDLYFVIMTANGSTGLAVECLQKGATDFITKPFFEDDLVRSIDLVQRKRKLDRRKRSLVIELEDMLREKTDELIQLNFSVLTALARAVEKKDLGTYGHSMRVSVYAEQIAKRFGLAPEERDQLRSAALLHDIGKIGISDSILGKPGPLTREELEIVRWHPENGVEILKPLKHYHPILPAILHHHEQYDGSGYPSGLSKARIPILARIIAVADTYDAILSDRPYRTAADRESAFRELDDKSGRQFDPAVVRAFLAAVPEKPASWPRAGEEFQKE